MNPVTDEVKGPPRRERAARTRRKIVDAAATEFRAHGYHGTTMAAIARRAAVAVQTVYFVFNSKPSLLTAAIDDAVMGTDGLPPQNMPWWQEGTTTADGRHALELFVTNTARIEERAAALDRVAHAAATTDPEIIDLIAHHDALRCAGFGQYVESLHERGLLAANCDPREVTDVFLTLLGSDVYLNFTEARGWSVDRYASWATDTLCALFLRKSALVSGSPGPNTESLASTRDS
jgi:AcrR family transcriptional regulator